MRNLTTSTRELSAYETLSAIRPLLLEHDIHGYADHTPIGVTSVRAVEIFRRDPRSGFMNLGKGFGLEASRHLDTWKQLKCSRSSTPPMFRSCGPPTSSRAPFGTRQLTVEFGG